MKRITLSGLIILFFTGMASAQAYEGTIEFDKKKQKAFVINYSYPTAAVENAIIKKMESLGYKTKEEKGLFNKDKGFLVYKNAFITDISREKMDYIVKVERKSRKQSDESLLYIIMNRSDGTNAIENMDAYDTDQAKYFLNNLLPNVQAANLELQIKEQEEIVAKAEKKLRDLKDDQTSLEKKLQDNKVAQDNTQKDIESQKQTLGTLIGKRKSN